MNLLFLLLYLFELTVLLIIVRPDRCEINTIDKGVFVLRTPLHVSTYLLIAIILTAGMLCATRSLDSYDTFVYVSWYETIQNQSFFQRDGRYGLLFEMLAKIVAILLNGNYQVFFFAIATLNLVIVYKAIMKYCSKERTAILTYLLYLVFIGFYYSFIVLRQGLAIAMVVSAYCVLPESKKKALLLCAAGTLFHESALIALLCVLLLYNTKIKLNRVMLYCITVISLFFYITHSTTRYIVPVLHRALNVFEVIDAATFHKYILYFEEKVLTYDVSLLYVLYYIITLGLIYLIYQQGKSGIIEDSNRFFITINVLGLAMLGFFAAASTIIRLAEYMCSCTYIFLIPRCLDRIMCWRDTKIIVAILMVILTTLQLRIILGPIYLFF